MVKPVRFHARYKCDIPAEIHSPASRRKSKLGEGRVVDIGVGGIGVVCEIPLDKSAPYEFRFKFEEYEVNITGRLAWEGPRDPKNLKSRRYGFSMNLSVTQEQLVKKVIDRIRHQQMPSDEGRLRDYWKI